MTVRAAIISLAQATSLDAELRLTYSNVSRVDINGDEILIPNDLDKIPEDELHKLVNDIQAILTNRNTVFNV